MYILGLRKRKSTDFDSIVKTKLDTMHTEGVFQDAVEKAVEKCVCEAVSSQFGYGGAAGKAINEAVKSSINIDLSNLGLPGYNETVFKIIERVITQAKIEPAQKELTAMLEKLFEAPPAEIKLSDLIEDFYNHLNEDFSDKDGDRPTIIVDVSERYHWEKEDVKPYWHLYLDGREDTEKYSCKYSIAFTGEGQAHSIKIGDQALEKNLFLGNFYRFEKSLFQIYTHKTKVIREGFDSDYIPSYSDREDR